MGDQGASSTTEYIPVRRKRPNLNILKLFIYRIEYSVLFFMLSYLLYTPLIEQYYYKSYGLRLLQGASFNRSAGEAFCLTEELLTNLSGSNETSKQVQSDANHLVAYGQLVKNILAIITTTLVIGPLTDRFGRKIGIVLPAVGSLLQGVLTIFIIKYDLNPYYFIITNFLNGLSGGFTSLLSSSFAYIADVSTMKYRSLRIGAIEGSIALGGGIGQLVGGLILESVHCNFIPPVLLYLTSNFVVLLYVLFILPESTSAEERRQDNTSIKQQFITYIKGFKMYCGEFSFNKNWNIYVATIAANVASFTIVGTVILSVFFLKTPPFDLSPFKIGIYQSVQSASQGLTNLIIPGVFTVLLSNPDPWLILTAFVCAGVGNLLLGFSNQSWQIYIREYLHRIGSSIIITNSVLATTKIDRKYFVLFNIHFLGT